ncbi:hypothetical protein [Phenylobacterium sp. Root700]|uniref:hypothetical protein n=1 Tax=Phenylobacterium sp. Root700 TaxID=1736591 RepID=UPI0006F8D6E9|nr:hypothetical protein [Phenylobacterium sp. Root700]KRB41587.1 hypothetical protein ASE02_04585 [Phenylobacterium sp. Root700]
MMSARTSFLVWWGLPILCAGFGALVANYVGMDTNVGPGGLGQGPLLLIGGYFAAVGLLAVIFRARQSQVLFDDRARFDKPVEAAMVALCAPVLVAGLWVFTTGFLADFGPSQTVRGRLQAVDEIGAFGRSYAIDLDNAAYPLLLQCRLQRNCGSPTPLLRLKAGSPVEAEVLNKRMLGLKVAGQELVSPVRQRTIRLAFGGGLLAALLLYTAAFVLVSTRLLLGHDGEADR